MFYRRNSKVRTTDSPEFLFRIAAKINVAYWATVNLLIIYFLHNAPPTNCQRHSNRRNSIKTRKPHSERGLKHCVKKKKKRFKTTDNGNNTCELLSQQLVTCNIWHTNSASSCRSVSFGLWFLQGYVPHYAAWLTSQECCRTADQTM